MTRTFTVAIMAAVMYVHFRDSPGGGYTEAAEAADRLYDSVTRFTER